MSTDNTPVSRALPKGTVLPHNYIIENVLGEGGFGITYSANLQYTDEQFAIKEYFPGDIAYRSTDGQGTLIAPYSGQQEVFEKGYRHFLTEAGVMRELRHLEHIASVKDIIETNGTIYLVMEFIDGITLKQYFTDNGAMPSDELLPLITPVIRDLIQVHKKGLLHRDISPDNLMLGTDNKLHMIDFGAAYFMSAPERQEMTVFLKSGFTPPEQYFSDGKLGAWTDIYGLCATIYYALTGLVPTESIRRLQNDEIPALADYTAICSWQAAAIEKGMSIHAADRFADMEELYQALIIPPIEVSAKQAFYKEQSMLNDKTVMPAETSEKLKKDNIVESRQSETNSDKQEHVRKSTTNKEKNENGILNIFSLKYMIGAIAIVGLIFFIVFRLYATTDSNMVINKNTISGESLNKDNFDSIVLTVKQKEEAATVNTTTEETSTENITAKENTTEAATTQSASKQESSKSSSNTSSSSKNSQSSKKKTKSNNDDGFKVIESDDDFNVIED